ncbi:MAG: peptide/nickel transport system substrate-binding protein [Actinomycetota bacterium]|nr:peptide/nickel transport system substrate-binding protein [Actinomycetota bacterium]
MGKAKIGLRSAAVVSLAAMALAACGGGSSGGSSGKSGNTPAGQPVKGGTLTMLSLNQEFTDLDPQRAYTGEDIAFLNAYMTRSLTAFKVSRDPKEQGTLVPDMATDTGTPANGGKDWSFTLRDGMKWEDGSPVTCEDVKYGVSRTFATDVITGGPTYAIQYLDIPSAKDGSSVYKGPYTTKGNDTAAYDKAVVCEGNKITFHLAKPVGDFNYTVTLGMGAVPKAADTAEKYTKKIVSNGPYKIQAYTKGNQMVLVRNENWSKDSDSYRPAYPDKIVVKFGLDQSVIDQRMIRDSGADQQAFMRESLLSSDLATVFNDPRYESRRVTNFSPYVIYRVINVEKVPDLKQRQAIAVAMDRAQLRQILGGKFAGDIADGVIKPNLAQDYAPSGMWTGLLGKTIPDSGDPEYAKQLIKDSGKPMPTITYSYSQNPDADKGAASIKSSLEKAGMKVKLNPIEASAYYTTIFDKSRATELMANGWGPDWPNASTVIPPLFTLKGGWDVGLVNDKAYNEKVAAALSETDRAKQATMWQDLNKEAMQQAWVVPTLFENDQRLAGSKVKSASGQNGQLYIGGSAGNWPYNDMYVQK